MHSATLISKDGSNKSYLHADLPHNKAGQLLCDSLCRPTSSDMLLVWSLNFEDFEDGWQLPLLRTQKPWASIQEVSPAWKLAAGASREGERPSHPRFGVKRPDDTTPTAIWAQLPGDLKEVSEEAPSWPLSTHTTERKNEPVWAVSVGVICSTAVDIKLAVRVRWGRAQLCLQLLRIKWCFVEDVKPDGYLKCREDLLGRRTEKYKGREASEGRHCKTKAIW